MGLSVLHIAAMPWPTHQGSQVHVRGLVEGLAAAGHEVTVATYAHGVGREPYGVRVIRGPTVPGGAFTSSGLHPSKPLQDLALATVVRRFLAGPTGRRVELVHAHNVEGPLVAALAGARRVGRWRPVVFDAHTAMGEELPTYLPPGLRRRRRLAALAGGLLDRGLPAWADATVTLSEHYAATLRSRGARVAVVPPGVHAHELRAEPAAARRRHHLDPGRPWIAYSGNLDGYQELDALVTIAGALARRGRPGPGWLVLTGDEPSDLGRQLVRAGVPRDALRLVHDRRWSTHRDGLAAADLSLVPRRHTAGFPVKLLASLGVGTPVVARGTSYRPMPGVQRAPDDAPEAVADFVQRLLTGGELAPLGEAARAHVLAHHTWTHRAADLTAFYRSLLPGPRRSRYAGAPR